MATKAELEAELAHADQKIKALREQRDAAERRLTEAEDELGGLRHRYNQEIPSRDHLDSLKRWNLALERTNGELVKENGELKLKVGVGATISQLSSSLHRARQECSSANHLLERIAVEARDADVDRDKRLLDVIDMTADFVPDGDDD